MESATAIGICTGLTQKHGAVNADNVEIIERELIGLAKWLREGEGQGAAKTVDEFREGWLMAWPDEWKN